MPITMETLLAPEVTAYVVGGFLLLGTGILLLFHCSSISHRKKRQRVEDGALDGGNDVNSKRFFRPWRLNKRKNALLNKFDVPSVIITPPSPLVGRLGLDDDSIGSSGEISQNSVVENGENGEDRECEVELVTQDGFDVLDFDSPQVSFFRRSSLGESPPHAGDKNDADAIEDSDAPQLSYFRRASLGDSSLQGGKHSDLPQVGIPLHVGQPSYAHGNCSHGSTPPGNSFHGGYSQGSSAHRGRSSSGGSSSNSSISSASGSSSRGKSQSPAQRAASARSEQFSVLTLSDADDDTPDDEAMSRLSSMEPGTSKHDFNIPVTVHCATK